MSRMPSAYKLPLGLPFYWEDEISGELRKAVHAYLDHAVDGKPFTAAQLELVRDYLEHWVKAPCWDSEAFEQEIRSLRETVPVLKSAEEIHDWIHKALEVGIDPL